MKTTFYKNTFLQTTACAFIILGNVAFAPGPQMTLEDIPGPSPAVEQSLPQAVPHQPIVNESAQPIVEDISPVVPSNNTPATSVTTIIAPLAKQPVQAATATAVVPQKPGASVRPHPVMATEEVTAPAVAAPAAKEAVAVPAPQPVVLEQPKTAQKPVVVEHRVAPATRVGEALPATTQAEAVKPTAEEAAKAVSNKKMLMFNAMAVLALVFLAFFNYFLWRSTRKQQGVTEEQLADARKALEEVNRVAMAGEKVEKPAKQKVARASAAKIGKEDAA